MSLSQCKGKCFIFDRQETVAFLFKIVAPRKYALTNAHSPCTVAIVGIKNRSLHLSVH